LEPATFIINQEPLIDAMATSRFRRHIVRKGAARPLRNEYFLADGIPIESHGIAQERASAQRKIDPPCSGRCV
jgi:hypothetical protein